MSEAVPGDAVAARLRRAEDTRNTLPIPVLMFCIVPAVLVSALPVPLAAGIAASYSGTPHVHLLVAALTAVPAMLCLLSPLAGRLMDAFGRIRLLGAALVLLAVAGMAPLWLDSLVLIVISRFGVGLGYMVVLTAVPTLIGDDHHGSRRYQLFGLLPAVGAVTATAATALSASVAATDWRAPFAIYAVGLVAAGAVAALARERRGITPAGARRLPPLQWVKLRVVCAVSLVVGVVFSVSSTQIPARLIEVGLRPDSILAALATIGALGVVLGSTAFAWVGRLGPARLLPVAFGVSGIGIIVFALATSPEAVTAGGYLASVGCGLLLSTVMTWSVASLNLEQRGRSIGWWSASFSIGPLLLPAVMFALGLFGWTASGVYVLIGAIALVTAPIARRLALRTERR